METQRGGSFIALKDVTHTPTAIGSRADARSGGSIAPNITWEQFLFPRHAILAPKDTTTPHPENAPGVPVPKEHM